MGRVMIDGIIKKKLRDGYEVMVPFVYFYSN